ncbi:cytochrome P450 [Streptosporangium becharense]|uniref:Cytochrome P450 n=1 Tax=Streptosporangium becharense TaxID=1816182 RepID=A0A7W9IM05_9ACTN|nr:cytochrome P450 [Streptosporangium becharense]MBB2910464.1 cytochrome P450 [Streptosporangium becharense]MBB5823207.1 cytochrome P450 [Streptosporangium becharense]
MTAGADSAVETLPVTASGDDEPGMDAGDRVVVIVGRCAGDERLEDELTARGWQVRVAGVPAGDHATCLEGITDFLAAPESPDRVVLLGRGEAGPTAMEFADDHPERVVAVVAVDSPGVEGHTPGDPVPEPPCPALVVTAADPGATASAVVSFLAGLDRQAVISARHWARLPALTPALLNAPEVIERLRQMGPVHRINAEGVATTWILTGHKTTTATLADPRLAGEVEITAGFRLQSDDPALAHRGEQDLITIDAQEHTRLRRLVGHYLTPKRVEALRPRMQREVDALLDAIPTGEEVDLLARFALPLPVIVLCDLLGVPERDRGYIHEWLVERMRATPPSAHGDIDDYLRVLIADRRNRPSDDLLGWVVEAEGDGLSENDLVSAARFLMVGGHRAPTTLLASGVAALLREREQWRRLVDDPALVVPAVEELLRFVTPFPVGLARNTTAPIDVEGTSIPKGNLIAASLVAANRDPSMFADPDTLDIGRAVNPHLSFGYGHHHCLGAALARAQAQIAIGTLARRFPDVELARDPRDLHYRQSRVRYLLQLPVVLEPDRHRSPAAGA